MNSNSTSFWEILSYVISAAAVVFFALPVHEFAHGFVASKLGDPTPRMQGRLTLNPMAHLDPIGSLGILLFGVGWAKPVGVNPRYFKSPKWGMAVTALAGPVSNIIMAFLSLIIMNLFVLLCITVGFAGEIAAAIFTFFYYLSYINVYLAVFNLIPIPPFDGSRILFAVLPSRYYFAVMRYERYIFVGLLILFFASSRLGVSPISAIVEKIISGIYSIVDLPFG
ncbi:MAG: site-2 protease family protein, partial [Clostridia bacterium]|nr:site-2 protease family protein [Clostridia bacterium]